MYQMNSSARAAAGPNHMHKVSVNSSDKKLVAQALDRFHRDID